MSNAIEDFKVSRSVFYLDNLSTSPKGKQGDIEIEMKFKSGERPEAVSRIVKTPLQRNLNNIYTA